MALLLDTNILVWTAIGDSRLPTRVTELLTSGSEALAVSAVVAWEFEDLHRRGRLPSDLSFEQVRKGMLLDVLDLPAEAWRVIQSLPLLHRDPIDRMLIAHALLGDFTIITSDSVIRDYPVRTYW